MITYNLATALERCRQAIINTGIKRPVMHWQSIELKTHATGMIEAFGVSFKTQVPLNYMDLLNLLKPSKEWVEDHFIERVSGIPLNPGEAYKKWPYYKMDKTMRCEPGEKFSHTYMERYWPKTLTENINCIVCEKDTMLGIRFNYGDLQDVVKLLIRDPYTRQAYLPVWFPEDTGNVNNVRVPCSLGYLFDLTQGYLNVTYYMRSCDYYRHLRDDIYLTCRLLHWVVSKMNGGVALKEGPIKVGRLTMHIANLHIFEHELKMLENGK